MTNNSYYSEWEIIRKRVAAASPKDIRDMCREVEWAANRNCEAVHDSKLAALLLLYHGHQRNVYRRIVRACILMAENEHQGSKIIFHLARAIQEGGVMLAPHHVFAVEKVLRCNWDRANNPHFTRLLPEAVQKLSDSLRLNAYRRVYLKTRRILNL